MEVTPAKENMGRGASNFNISLSLDRKARKERQQKKVSAFV
jgi:hypothetical protein